MSRKTCFHFSSTFRARDIYSVAEYVYHRVKCQISDLFTFLVFFLEINQISDILCVFITHLIFQIAFGLFFQHAGKIHASPLAGGVQVRAIALPEFSNVIFFSDDFENSMIKIYSSQMT